VFLNRSTQYTLQALLYLAEQPRGRMVLVREIAERLGLPLHYLAKLMYPLSHAGWLDSLRGRNGGYRLRASARGLSVLAILERLQSSGAGEECLLGLKACGDDDACVLHCQWRPIREEMHAYLGTLTLGDIADCKGVLPAGLLDARHP
jgi:Rrf2 family protein